MAQNKNSNDSERVCKKLYNAVFISPVSSKTHRISNQYAQPHHSIPAIDVPKPSVMNTHSSANTSPLQAKPVHIVHQLKFPFEAEPTVANFPVQKIKKGVMIEDDYSMHDRSNEREAMFSYYISKVKNQMMETESNVGGSNIGGGGVGRIPTRRDSFNDKVTIYISRAKLKIRTTTNVGDRKSFSFK